MYPSNDPMKNDMTVECANVPLKNIRPGPKNPKHNINPGPALIITYPVRKTSLSVNLNHAVKQLPPAPRGLFLLYPPADGGKVAEA